MTTTRRSTSRSELGIIGPAGDPQVVCVASALLRRRGRDPVVLDLGRFPRTLRLSVRDGVPRVHGVDLAAVGSWYVRSLPLPLPFRVAPDGDDGPGNAPTPRAGRRGRSWPAS